MENQILINEEKELMEECGNAIDTEDSIQQKQLENDIPANSITKDIKIKKGELQLRNELTEMLLKMGCRANLSGFDYLVDAIIFHLKNKGRHIKHTEELLVYLSKIYNKGTKAIERNIRHIISDLWNVGRIDEINKVINIRVFRKNDKPSETIFISTIAKVINKYIYINGDFIKTDD